MESHQRALSAQKWKKRDEARRFSSVFAASFLVLEHAPLSVQTPLLPDTRLELGHCGRLCDLLDLLPGVSFWVHHLAVQRWPLV